MRLGTLPEQMAFHGVGQYKLQTHNFFPGRLSRTTAIKKEYSVKNEIILITIYKQLINISLTNNKMIMEKRQFGPSQKALDIVQELTNIMHNPRKIRSAVNFLGGEQFVDICKRIEQHPEDFNKNSKNMCEELRSYGSSVINKLETLSKEITEQTDCNLDNYIPLT